MKIASSMRLPLIFASLCVLFPAGISNAHDIPNDVTVQIYVHPEGDRLTLLVRAPLEAMRDTEWPTHEPGFLDLEATAELLEDAATLWIVNDVEVFADGARVAEPSIIGVRVSIPSDPSFASYESAVSHLLGPPLPLSTDLYWQQALIDVMFEYPISSAEAEFSIRPGMERLGLNVLTLVRFIAADGIERVFQFGGDPGRVVLDPRWHQAALTFVRLGFGHILGGIDHLLFLLCLVIPLRRLRPLITVVTAFTLAHSITLIAAAYGLTPSGLWFPPLVETLIAASIVYMAIGNILRPDVEHRWLLAFGFGLVHGFGFSFALAETMQLAGDHLPTALFSFNVGVELGQLIVLILLIPAIHLFLKLSRSEQPGTVVLSVLVGHTAWHWMLERGGTLGGYSWDGVAGISLPLLLRWLLLLVIVVAAAWLFSVIAGSGASEAGRLQAPQDESPAS